MVPGLLLLTALLGAPPAGAEPVVVRITETDLNAVLLDAARASGWPVFEGVRSDPSRGLYDLRYRATLTEPTLGLGGGGQFSLDFDVENADVRVGRIERRVARLKLRCDELGLQVAPDRPLDVRLAFHLALDEGRLQFAVDELATGMSRNSFRLIRPERCRHPLFPKWLIWMLGKPKLKRKLSRIDEVLEARAGAIAEELSGDGALIAETWEIGGKPYTLRPSRLDTSGNALTVGLSLDGLYGASAPPALPAMTSGRSWVAVSGTLLNTLITAAMPAHSPEPRPPGDSLRKVLKSDAIHTLIPGLRDVQDRQSLLYSVSLGEPPLLELDRTDEAEHPGAHALLRFRLSGIEVALWQPRGEELQRIGRLEVRTATVAVAPWASGLGGISLDTVENEWTVAGSGVEHNEELIAATLQEIVFGELFETRYRPLAREGVFVGETTFQPAGFEVSDGYLFIEVAPPGPEISALASGPR